MLVWASLILESTSTKELTFHTDDDEKEKDRFSFLTMMKPSDKDFARSLCACSACAHKSQGPLFQRECDEIDTNVEPKVD